MKLILFIRYWYSYISYHITNRVSALICLIQYRKFISGHKRRIDFSQISSNRSGNKVGKLFRTMQVFGNRWTWDVINQTLHYSSSSKSLKYYFLYFFVTKVAIQGLKNVKRVVATWQVCRLLAVCYDLVFFSNKVS